MLLDVIKILCAFHCIKITGKSFSKPPNTTL